MAKKMLKTEVPLKSKFKKVNTWVFEVPDVHPSINTWTRKHFHVRNALKKEWETMVFYAAKEAKIPQMDFPVEIFITYVHPRSTVDLDNYTPKFIMDGLKCFFGDDNIKIVKKIGWRFVKMGTERRSIIEISKYSE